MSMEEYLGNRKSIAEHKAADKEKEHKSYWKEVLKSYEMRNESLEKRRSALVERVHFMECALPSLLMGAAVINTKQRPSEQISKNPQNNSTVVK